MAARLQISRSGAASRRILQQFNSRTAVSSSLYTSAARQRLRGPNREVSVFALAVPRRNYATETSTSQNSGGSGPPPGFNMDEAKKPLPQEANKQEAASPNPTIEELKKSGEVLTATVAGKPSDVPPTAAVNASTLTELATQKAKEEEKQNQLEKAGGPKKTLWQKIKHEARHYYDGTKLLATEVKISSKLALKMAAGYELSRRENRQLQRTVQDLGRLVPFSVFVIVPFAELLLPVALKLFPNLLPSTYEGQQSREDKASRLRSTRKNVSSFLRNSLKESGLPISKTSAQTEEFQLFFRKVRATGESPTKEDVLKVCKIFKDDLTLDNLSRPQLVGMCKYMNLNTFGTDTMLRYQIRHRMRQIKRDDKAISFEGVDSLSVPELQMACASRGLRTHGMSPGKLREDLQMWLDLRLKYNIPSTLLVLSNAYMYTSGKDSEIDSQIEALQAVLSSIPEELFHEIELEVHNAEGAATNKQRLEVLKEQQELIEEENKQAESSKTDDGAAKESPKDDKDIDETPKKAAASSKDAAKSESTAAEVEAKEAEADVSEQGKEESRLAEKEVQQEKAEVKKE